ncbi:MAG: class I SAM-dependent DNA methyltransferase [Roseiflexus sp.]
MPGATSDIYHAYAPFYDGSGQIRFAILFAHYLLEDILPRHSIDGRRVLDLACGTGTLALILADAGWQVTGVDRSSAMLAIARNRAQTIDAALRPCFIEADMRWLWQTGRAGEHRSEVHPGSFHLVTCTYDSLNYMLTEEELAACFATAAEALVSGGLFLGDMNTRHFLEYEWGEVEIIERPGFVQINRSRFDPETSCSTMRLIGFVGDDDGGYERFEEVHVERAYAPETVAALITGVGLTLEAVYDCFTTQPVGERTQRIVWIARKQ